MEIKNWSMEKVTFNRFIPKYLKKNCKNLQLSSQIPKSLSNPLINPGSRFFPNMSPYSNDAPYCLLSSCKQLETFYDIFGRKWSKAPILDTEPYSGGGKLTHPHLSEIRVKFVIGASNSLTFKFIIFFCENLVCAKP